MGERRYGLINESDSDEEAMTSEQQIQGIDPVSGLPVFQFPPLEEDGMQEGLPNPPVWTYFISWTYRAQICLISLFSTAFLTALSTLHPKNTRPSIGAHKGHTFALLQFP